MKDKKSVLIYMLLAVIVCAGVAGCSFWKVGTPQPYKETRFLMDTVIDITAYGPNAKQAVTVAFDEFQRFHDLSNHFDPDSQVSQVNQAAGVNSVTVAPELIAMIRRSNALSDQFEGAFDVTVGPLTELWGVGRKGDYVPSQMEIDRVLPLVDYRRIQLDDEKHTIYLPQTGMMLDLGGIAKGYATDKAVEVLKAQGITSALVNAGGDVRVVGHRPDGQPWRIGVQDPRNSEQMTAKLALTDWDTMETSGDYQRFMMKDGVRYSHILDPHSGWQPREVSSVTIVNNNSGDGDILSTAVFVLGLEKGLRCLQQIPGTEALVVTTDGQVIVTPGLEGKVELTTGTP